MTKPNFECPDHLISDNFEKGEEIDKMGKKSHDLRDCSIEESKHDGLKINSHHFQCVSSIAFNKISASGVVILCLQGCSFRKFFTNYNTMIEFTTKHFEEKHKTSSTWTGFCSSCTRYVISKKRRKNLTIADELLHIKRGHTIIKKEKT